MTNPLNKPMSDRTASAINEPTLPPDWMMFPALNEAWTQSADATIALMAERIKAFKTLAASASPAELTRARLIAQSYVRVHAVLQELYSTSKHLASFERTII
jgi:hypothetical protein